MQSVREDNSPLGRLLRFEDGSMSPAEVEQFLQELIDEDMLLFTAEQWKNYNLLYLAERLLQRGVIHPKYRM